MYNSYCYSVEIKDHQQALVLVCMSVAPFQHPSPSHSVNYRHKHNLGPFTYPTLGIPTPGKIYNSTKVSRKDLPSFDDKLNQLFKPYNVSLLRFRIPIANMLDTEITVMEDM